MKLASLLAISDLHVEHEENRLEIAGLSVGSAGDCLLVAGDVSNSFDRLSETLEALRARFEMVVWVPGNHELHGYMDCGEPRNGPERYLAMVEICRSLGVVTPEDPYPIWHGPMGAVRIVPLFLLYDYSFGVTATVDRAEALRRAYEADVVCDDEFLIHPAPFSDVASWCAARVRQAECRLEQVDGTPTVLVNHFPLRAEATHALLRPEFAQWCGTRRTEKWHLRFRAIAVVYGHLHIPRTMWHDGVPFEEVSLGYPRHRRLQAERAVLRQVLPRSTNV